MKAGLNSGYPSEKNVYYTSGGWHGYSGNLQSGSSAHYIVCTEHNAKSYAASQVPDEPEEEEENEEKPEGGSGDSTEAAAAHHDHDTND